MIYCLSTLPPSNNALFVKVGKATYKTYEYNAWIAKAMQEVKRYPPFHAEKFACDIMVPWWSHRNRGDIHNYAKAVIDLFVRAKLIKDDKHCICATIGYVISTTSGKIEVEFRSSDEHFADMQEYAEQHKDNSK